MIPFDMASNSYTYFNELYSNNKKLLSINYDNASDNNLSDKEVFMLAGWMKLRIESPIAYFPRLKDEELGLKDMVLKNTKEIEENILLFKEEANNFFKAKSFFAAIKSYNKITEYI